ncbi:LOW QUALITY PROTEIN: hypothetical protein KIPB_001557 [Kipferlia bialata]|uniref:Uncharacterized protein n=1 Tax=Kipferlia bialata TaxID=797122 RepID=A0A9K3CNW0_9EUKA|nr:LOW QUALITY PROTEIN: hypothetical protein KIPB_001557 [Kipferlia bialata]
MTVEESPAFVVRCSPFRPTATLHLMKVLDDAMEANGDVGPLRQAAEYEEDSQQGRIEFWAALARLSELFSLKHRGDTDYINHGLRQENKFPTYHGRFMGSYEKLCMLWTVTEVTNRLTALYRMVHQMLSTFPSPQIRQYRTLDVQLKYLTGALSDIRKERDVLEIDTAVVTRAFRNATGRMLAEASQSAYSAAEAIMVCMAYLNLALVADESLSPQQFMIYKHVYGQDWESLRGCCNTERLQTLQEEYSVLVSKLNGHPKLQGAVDRLFLLEAAGPLLDGLCASVLGSESNLAAAAEIILTCDGAMHALAGLVGNTPRRSFVFGHTSVSHNIYIAPDLIGRTLTDLSLYRLMLVLSALNPVGFLSIASASTRASSMGTHVEAVDKHPLHPPVDAVYSKSISQKIPFWSVLLSPHVNTLVASDVPCSFVVLSFTSQTYAVGSGHSSAV